MSFNPDPAKMQNQTAELPADPANSNAGLSGDMPGVMAFAGLQSTGPQSKKLVMQICGTLDDINENLEKACWKARNQNFNAFAHPSGKTSKVVFDKFVLEHVQSSFPVPLGLNFTGVQGRVHADNGKTFAHVAMPHVAWHGEEVLLSPEESVAANAFRAGFPGYNEGNLRKIGVADIANEDFVFVDEAHPVISMIEQNHSVFQMDVASADRVDGRYLKIERGAYDVCIDSLESQLKKDVHNIEPSKFQATASKINNKPFNHHDDLMLMDTSDTSVTAACSSRCQCTIIARVDYTHM